METYLARALSRRGRVLHTTEGYPTREEAVSAAWVVHPDAKSVSSGRGYGGGFDMRCTIGGRHDPA